MDSQPQLLPQAKVLFNIRYLLVRARFDIYIA